MLRILHTITPLTAKAVAVGVSVLWCIAASDTSQAQTTPCPPTSQTAFSIHLDDVSFSQSACASDAKCKELSARLEFKLRNRLEALFLETPSIPLILTRCVGRNPAGFSEFDDDFVDKLNDDKVLMELWGYFDAMTDSSGVSRQECRIYHVLIPVQMDQQSGNDLRGFGFQSVLHAEDSGQTQDLVDLMAGTPELDLFVAMSLGIKKLRNHEYDLAWSQLGEANTRLARCEGSTSLNTSTRSSIDSYIKNAMERTLTIARADTSYHGFLQEESITTP